ncbi:hypothetical protein Ae706Ps2_6516 [Pseudonocardia sp. Ae706_Ps2]|nr:hypothetical protein Ae706Ps2_6514 [Pseudonocardia sp. Ae706_Ps2]OLM09323.1 hypothetical protein Ae706Ps2_6516 [Pseudonocardia sp. Ae706_Ps2]
MTRRADGVTTDHSQQPSTPSRAGRAGRFLRENT